jgi:hypothetical protein
VSVKQEIESKRIGYAFSISIEKELRIENVSKYPDKTIIKASLEGNTDTYEQAVDLLKKSKTDILAQVKEAETK